VVVSLYRLGFPEAVRPYPADRFNPAVDSRTDIVPGEAEPAPAAAAAGGVSAEAVFGEIAKRVEADASLVQKVNAVYQFVVTSGSGEKKSWTVDLKSGPKGKVTAGASSGADCTLTLAEKDFVDLVQGKLDAQGAFLKGLLKVRTHHHLLFVNLSLTTHTRTLSSSLARSLHAPSCSLLTSCVVCRYVVTRSRATWALR
jgi:hypothetical protein